jgi:hypothetical protein
MAVKAMGPYSVDHVIIRTMDGEKDAAGQREQGEPDADAARDACHHKILNTILISLAILLLIVLANNCRNIVPA